MDGDEVKDKAFNIQFGDEWPGVFIPGLQGGTLAHCITLALRGEARGRSLEYLQGLRDLLVSTSLDRERVQTEGHRLRPFDECLALPLSVKELVLQFWEGHRRNSWLEHGALQVYVRRGYHLIGGSELECCLDLATIEVAEECRGQGVFTRFLEEVEAMSLAPIYVENVLDERFATFWLRRGYTSVGHDPDRCYVRYPHPTTPEVAHGHEDQADP